MKPRSRTKLWLASDVVFLVGQISLALGSEPDAVGLDPQLVSWEGHGMLVSWMDGEGVQITRQNASMDWQRAAWIIGYCQIHGFAVAWPQ